MLAQDFHAYGALPRNHERVVKRVDESQPLLLLQRKGVLVRIGIAVARQHHFAAARAHRVHLHLRRGGGHDDDGARAQPLRRQRHALRVVAGAGANHAFFKLPGRQMRHLVVRAAQLEAEHRLLVFALEQHLAPKAAAEVARRLQRRLNRHVIHARREHALQIVKTGEGVGHGANFPDRQKPRIIGAQRRLSLHRTKKRAKKGSRRLVASGAESTY